MAFLTTCIYNSDNISIYTSAKHYIHSNGKTISQLIRKETLRTESGLFTHNPTFIPEKYQYFILVYNLIEGGMVNTSSYTLTDELPAELDVDEKESLFYNFRPSTNDKYNNLVFKNLKNDTLYFKFDYSSKKSENADGRSYFYDKNRDTV